MRLTPLHQSDNSFTFYLGVLFLRDNDPWHFRSIEIAMVTLMRAGTFDGWGDTFYIGYYGCDVYTMGVYTSHPEEDQGLLGGVVLCAHPQAQPVFVSIYWVSFLFFLAFAILSLIIGAIGDAMMNAALSLRRRTAALKHAWYSTPSLPF